MEKDNISDLDRVKRLTTTNMGNDIRAWLRAHPDKDLEMFAKEAGISLRTVESIIYFDGTGKEPNWTRTTEEGIMKALGGFEAFYTPPHEIK